MDHSQNVNPFCHPRVTRRTAIQAGSVSLLGLGMNHLAGLRSAEAASIVPSGSSITAAASSRGSSAA